MESIKQEAASGVILNLVCSIQKEGVKRIVIHANDTDIIVIVVYYAGTLLKDLAELWVGRGADTYLAP